MASDLSSMREVYGSGFTLSIAVVTNAGTGVTVGYGLDIYPPVSKKLSLRIGVTERSDSEGSSVSGAINSTREEPLKDDVQNGDLAAYILADKPADKGKCTYNRGLPHPKPDQNDTYCQANDYSSDLWIAHHSP